MPPRPSTSSRLTRPPSSPSSEGRPQSPACGMSPGGERAVRGIPSADNHPGGRVTMTKQIDQVLQRAADSGDVPGVVAMAANDNGVIYEGAFGKRSLADPAPMTLDTVFRIAS